MKNIKVGTKMKYWKNLTDEEKLQAKFISQFIDIYENSFKRE